MKILIILALIGSLAFVGGRHPFGKVLRPIVFTLAGLIIGPMVLGLFTHDQILLLKPLALFTLAWVGLVIGMQADLQLWRIAGARLVRYALVLGACSGFLAGIPTFFILWLVVHVSFPFALAGAVMMAAAAAASTTMRAGKSSLDNLAAACAGLDDLVSLLFAFFPFAVIDSRGNLVSFNTTMLHIGVMILLGILFGIAIILLIGNRAKIDERLTVVAGMVALIAGASGYLGVTPFVVGGVAGVMLVNTRAAPKEKIYEVLVDAERPVGLFMLIFAGAMVTDLTLLGLLIGACWAVFRLWGNQLGARLLKAPEGLDEKLSAVSPIVVVVATSFVLLTPTPFAPLLLESAVIGWFLTETCLLWKNRDTFARGHQ